MNKIGSKLMWNIRLFFGCADCYAVDSVLIGRCAGGICTRETSNGFDCNSITENQIEFFA